MEAEEDFIIKDPTAFTALTKIHKAPVLDCCFSPDTDQLLSGSEDTTIVLWNLPTNVSELHDDTINDEHKLVCYRLSDHKTPVMSVAMHERLFISASKDGQVKLWKLLPNHYQQQTQYRQSSYSRSTNSTQQQNYHLQETFNSDEPIFKKPNPEPTTYTCHARMIRSTTFSTDARSFATGSDDKSVKIWSTECKNKMLVSLTDGHTNWIRSVRWAKTNESLLASCGDDGKICIWDTRVRVRQPPCDLISSARRRMQFNCLDWHPVFEHHIATGSHDSSCAVWDLRNRKQVQVYTEHNGSVNSVAFNKGGSLLLTGSNDQTSKIFDVCEGRNMFTLLSHRGPVTSVCFNNTDELFATASSDKTVTIWRRNFDTINIVDEKELDDSNMLIQSQCHP